MLRLIIRGKWKSPNHSNDRSKDDTHEIKRKILKEVGEYLYSKDVGKNPDIDIDPKTKKIKLKGRGKCKGKEFESDINADKYFSLSFILASELEPLYAKVENEDIPYDYYYVIPPDIDVLEKLLDYLIKQECEINVHIQIVI